MLEKLRLLYGEEKGKKIFLELEKLVQEAKTKIISEDRSLWDEKDVALITYPDSFGTLKTLETFLTSYLKNSFSLVHILPFFPYSSDRGFSITDYYQVKKEFGSWSDIENIAKKYRVMADLVLNHVSVKHEWFQKFLEGDPKYEDYFIWFEKEKIPEEDLKKVSRPRATPLLTPFKTAKGERWVWTTFSVENSTDQVDLNYKNPEVFLEIVKIILFLLEKRVKVFRIDAAPYIWKEIGTDCENLPQVHTVFSLIRNILDLVCPAALIVAQSSLSFAENVSYFGLKDDEAQLIYNFALPPLLLDAFYSQNSNYLEQMANKMISTKPDRSFLNILALHDGVGVSAVRDVLSKEHLQRLYDETEARSGKLGYRFLADGSKTVVELNITWWSALNIDNENNFDLQLRKFITSYAIAFSLAGIPAVYYLSLFGKENDLELFAKTGIKRDINRNNLDLRLLDFRFQKQEKKEAKVFSEMLKLIEKRKSLKAFHPNSKQEVLKVDKRIFALLRGEGSERVLALHNLSDLKIEIDCLGKRYNLEAFSYIWEKIG